jgi:hypothetical protein
MIKAVNCKLSHKDSKSNAIHYTVSELKNRGFKRGDYKRFYNRLNNGTLESGLKYIYSKTFRLIYYNGRL